MLPCSTAGVAAVAAPPAIGAERSNTLFALTRNNQARRPAIPILTHVLSVPGDSHSVVAVPILLVGSSRQHWFSRMLSLSMLHCRYPGGVGTSGVSAEAQGPHLLMARGYDQVATEHTQSLGTGG